MRYEHGSSSLSTGHGHEILRSVQQKLHKAQVMWKLLGSQNRGSVWSVTQPSGIAKLVLSVLGVEADHGLVRSAISGNLMQPIGADALSVDL